MCGEITLAGKSFHREKKLANHNYAYILQQDDYAYMSFACALLWLKKRDGKVFGYCVFVRFFARTSHSDTPAYIYNEKHSFWPPIARYPAYTTAGILFTERQDVLWQDLVKSRSREIQLFQSLWNLAGTAATAISVIITSSFAASRLHEIQW